MGDRKQPTNDGKGNRRGHQFDKSAVVLGCDPKMQYWAWKDGYYTPADFDLLRADSDSLVARLKATSAASRDAQDQGAECSEIPPRSVYRTDDVQDQAAGCSNAPPWSLYRAGDAQDQRAGCSTIASECVYTAEELSGKGEEFHEKTAFLRGLAASYFMRQDFHKARDILRTVNPRQNCEDNLDSVLLWAECDLYVDEGTDVTRVFRDLVLARKDVTCSELLEWSMMIAVKGRLLGSIIILYALKDKFKIKTPNLYSTALGDLVYDAGVRAAGMAIHGKQNEKQVVQRYVLPMLWEMQKEFNHLEDNDSKKLSEARCHLGIGICQIWVNRVPEGRKELETGKVILEGLSGDMDIKRFTNYLGMLKAFARANYMTHRYEIASEVLELCLLVLRDHGETFMTKDDLEVATRETTQDYELNERYYDKIVASYSRSYSLERECCPNRYTFEAAR